MKCFCLNQFQNILKWKSTVDDNKVFGAALTDLVKTFGCLSHELLLAKLNEYGFSMAALILNAKLPFKSEAKD